MATAPTWTAWRRRKNAAFCPTCFSVEPGIYLKDFGIRSEVNVFVDAGGAVHVTGGTPQTQVVALLDVGSPPF